MPLLLQLYTNPSSSPHRLNGEIDSIPVFFFFDLIHGRSYSSAFSSIIFLLRGGNPSLLCSSPPPSMVSLANLFFAARNLIEEKKKEYREIHWDDREVCGPFMVRFCQHDLFVNTKRDLTGNLKSAMNCSYVMEYEFVVIFDANFQPTPDFLKKIVPDFKGNDDLALGQARWSFVNNDENLLTRLQNINVCFHFEVEQQVNGIFINFFGFSGTAGVWRIKVLEDSGGWLERTTVEDMDIAVRAHLKG